MEVGEWWLPNEGLTCGLFSVHPAVTDVYYWHLYGSPTKLKIESDKVVLRTVHYPIHRFVHIVIVKYATYIRSIVPTSSGYRTICG